MADKPREAVVADALQAITIPLSRYGYVLENQTDASLTYSRKFRPWPVWVCAVLFFPIGLLALLVTEHAYVQIAFEQDGSTTTMRIAGDGERKVCDAFERLSI